MFVYEYIFICIDVRARVCACACAGVHCRSATYLSTLQSTLEYPTAPVGTLEYPRAPCRVPSRAPGACAQVYHNRTALAHLFDQLVRRYPHLATLVDITAK